MLLTSILCHFKTLPKCIEMSFLCVIHGPQICMKWMYDAFRWWNLCFCKLLWCFNPVDTSHHFLREKIAPYDCGVKSRLRVHTCVLAFVSDTFSTIRLDIFLTLKGIEWRLKIWFLMATYTHCLKITMSKLHCQMFVSQYKETVCFQV